MNCKHSLTNRIIKRFIKPMAVECVLLVAMGLAQLMLVQAISGVADSLFQGNFNFSFGKIVLTSVAIIGMILVTPLLSIVRGKLSARSTVDMQTLLFEDSISQRWDVFQSLGSGEYLYRLTNDIYTFRNHLFTLISENIANVILIAIACCQLAVVSVSMTLWCMAISVLPFFITFAVKNRLKKKYDAMKSASGELFGLRTAILENADEFYVNGIWASSQKKVSEYSNRYLGIFTRQNGFSKGVDSLLSFLHIFSWGVILAISAGIVARGGMNAAGLILFIGIFERIRIYVRTLFNSITVYQEYRGVRDRISEMIDSPENEGNGVYEKSDEDDNAVTWNGLGITIDGKRIFHDLTGKLKRGEKAALIGKNGAGKSTFLNCLCGLRQANEGDISIFGQNVSCMPRDDMLKDVSACFDTAVYFDGTYGDNVLETPGINKATAEALVEMFEIGHIWNRKYDANEHISGGEQKKLELVRALARDSRLCVLDEPESMLDEKSKMRLIEYIKRDDRTYIISSHDADVINRCSTSIELSNDAL